MQEFNVTKSPISDGKIEKLICTRNTLVVKFTDWQEKSWEITFDGLIAFHGICAVGAEICDMYEEKSSRLSQEAERQGLSETGTSYSFTSSNGGEVIFIVVAASYSARKIN
ncbi:hypothetical protein [Pseudomonas kitaguniensis]|uniref:hypothetical protein n=1 Tax=Pseudomonas kitaguniensis TaxID=2607908 RepID=UPI003D067F27